MVWAHFSGSPGWQWKASQEVAGTRRSPSSRLCVGANAIGKLTCGAVARGELAPPVPTDAVSGGVAEGTRMTVWANGQRGAVAGGACGCSGPPAFAVGRRRPKKRLRFSIFSGMKTLSGIGTTSPGASLRSGLDAGCSIIDGSG